jgi:sulfhydrogenase subunit delta
MKYLGIKAAKPRIGVFDFTSCEGCELQLANKEETLGAFLSAVTVVNFREVSSAKSDDYDIAFIEGSITRGDEVERLNRIRANAKVVVALGSCACFGGVNRLKNVYDAATLNREVYGDKAKATLPTRAIKQVIKVDLEIPGCPVCKDEVEKIVQRLVFGLPYAFPRYPVCVECKQRETICMFDKGLLCVGSVTRAGCSAPCPAAGLGCWGCRGPAPELNMESFLALAKERGFTDLAISERLNFFGGFEEKR